MLPFLVLQQADLFLVAILAVYKLIIKGLYRWFLEAGAVNISCLDRLVAIGNVHFQIKISVKG